LTSLLGDQYEYTLENRIKKKESDVSIRNAYKIVIGALAGLLACIGLANVFSNALGHIYQRKREFARYITIGLTPAGVKKVLISEAFILGFKPIAVSLLINIPLVFLALKASLIDSKEFIRKMPATPIILFAVVIVSAVGFAYYLRGRKIYNADLVEAIKDDTMI
jgi:putative ABC transport system permease protein